MTEVMERAKLSHAVVFRDAACYSAHPHMAVAADRTWLLVFTQAPRRPVVLHPPLDPDFRNMLLRSTDEGRTWQGPEPVPDADATGMECAGLTPLPDGRVILNQWQFDWIDPDGIDLSSAGPDVALPDWLARARAGSVDIGVLGTREDDADLFRLARCNGGCRISVAADGGAPFVPATSPPTAPYSGGYGMRGAVIAGNGDILLPLSDVPHYARIFILRSSDDGTTWGAPEHVCAKVDCEFEEPAPIRLPDGEILIVLRENISRRLHAVRSADDGRTWSAPVDLRIEDYPADLLLLHDGRLAMVAGRRREPFGIGLYLSADGGRSWSEPWMIRDDLPDIDLGYPTLAQRENGDLVVVYYGRDEAGITGLQSTTIPEGELRGRGTP